MAKSIPAFIPGESTRIGVYKQGLDYFVEIMPFEGASRTIKDRENSYCVVGSFFVPKPYERVKECVTNTFDRWIHNDLTPSEGHFVRIARDADQAQVIRTLQNFLAFALK